jgi:hypothetical protein
VLRAILAWAGAGLVICALSLACGPSPAQPPAPTADAFAVVRATSQAAYLAGQTAVARGDALGACVDFDLAKTNDPDNRADIQQALERALASCLTVTPAAQATSAPVAAPQRTLVVATIAAGVGTALAGTPNAGSASTSIAAQATNATAPTQSATPVTAATSAAAPGQAPTPAAAAATPPPTTNASAATALTTWRDPQGRFSIGAPQDWARVDQPPTLVGTGVVEFHDASNRAELDVSVDSATRAVSPELYAASLELAMQRQVPGYASEQIVPGTIAGSPSIRRVFTFTQRDASGQDHQARGFQLVVVRGSTPYLISATSPTELFDQFSPTFNDMVDSFRFS